MPKNRLNDFSTSADANTDVLGIGIQGTNKPSNLDDAIRALMKILADWRDTLALNDTASFNDIDDISKIFRFDAGTIPTATTRVISAENSFRLSNLGPIPRAVTYYRTAGTFTHTFDEKTSTFRLFLMAAGGDGGNVDGDGAGTGASASGGNSGNWAWTNYLAKGGLEDGDLVIGAPGVASTGASADGCNGNNTTWNDGINSFTVRGGRGGSGRVAGGQYGVAIPVTNIANVGALVEENWCPGDMGQGSATFNLAVRGGQSPFGTCLPAGMSLGITKDGMDAIGNGSGGGGSAVSGVSANARGGRGAPGMAIVMEY